jgi:hypothetical protein
MTAHHQIFVDYTMYDSQQLLKELKAEADAQPCFDAARNPAAVALAASGSLDDMDYVVAQYSQFPRTIVRMLWAARAIIRQRDNELSKDARRHIDNELTRNIGQELGSETEGRSHYEVLSDGLEQTIALRPSAHQAASATRKFLNSLMSACKNSDPYAVLGTVYAMETTAGPELGVVQWLYQVRIQHVAGEVRTQPGWAEANESIRKFFDMHMDVWELSHSNELAEVVLPALTTDDRRARFRSAFERVIDLMRVWWEELAAELQDTVA